ncbi:hypothetical protein JTB14_007782 [Gonioctena quinquepunctata]|nr:hypothetical protein JTB14_007782 [Gonioctena quinquepunctata]
MPYLNQNLLLPEALGPSIEPSCGLGPIGYSYDFLTAIYTTTIRNFAPLRLGGLTHESPVTDHLRGDDNRASFSSAYENVLT